MKSKQDLMAKPALSWEVRTCQADQVIPLHKAAHSRGLERETTITEWTVGGDQEGGQRTTKITMVSSGFGEVVKLSTVKTNMQLAA